MALDRTLSTTERAAQERRLIDDYVLGTGQDPQLVRARTDEAARMLLMSAAAFAASRLRASAQGSGIRDQGTETRSGIRDSGSDLIR